MRIPLSVSALALAVFLGPIARATTVVDNASGWNVGDYAGIDSDIATQIGQTFTVVGSDNHLTSLKFPLQQWISGPIYSHFTYTLSIIGWDGSKGAGAPLYQSASASSATLAAKPGWSEVTFNTGDLPLSTGSQYLAYLTMTPAASKNYHIEVGAIYSDTYLNGAVYYHLATDPTTGNWNTYIAAKDAAFTATFIPDPSSITVAAVAVMLAMRTRAVRKEGCINRF